MVRSVPTMRPTPEEDWTTAALIGKAGEALLATELLCRGVNVASPAFDGGIDLLAYREPDFTHLPDTETYLKQNLR